MKRGSRICIKKMRAAVAPKSPMAPEGMHKAGQLNDGYTLPIDYEVRGVLLADIEVGARIGVFRTHRNGVACAGSFVSTPVKAIRGGIAYSGCHYVDTNNSVYMVRPDEEKT